MGWTGFDILESTAYGKLYLIIKISGRKVLGKRVRRNKNALYSTREQKWVTLGPGIKADPSLYDLLFFDTNNDVSLLKPTNDFKESLSEMA